MTSDEEQPPIALLPASIAAVLAAIGVAGMIFLFVSAERIPDGEIGMRSASEVYRAGATLTPTQPNSAQPSDASTSNASPSRSMISEPFRF